MLPLARHRFGAAGSLRPMSGRATLGPALEVGQGRDSRGDLGSAPAGAATFPDIIASVDERHERGGRRAPSSRVSAGRKPRPDRTERGVRVRETAPSVASVRSARLVLMAYSTAPYTAKRRSPRGTWAARAVAASTSTGRPEGSPHVVGPHYADPSTCLSIPEASVPRWRRGSLSERDAPLRRPDDVVVQERLSRQVLREVQPRREDGRRLPPARPRRSLRTEDVLVDLEREPGRLVPAEALGLGSAAGGHLVGEVHVGDE